MSMTPEEQRLIQFCRDMAGPQADIAMEDDWLERRARAAAKAELESLGMREAAALIQLNRPHVTQGQRDRLAQYERARQRYRRDVGLEVCVALWPIMVIVAIVLLLMATH